MYDLCAEFYHGDEPNRPSQIKLLAGAHINYRDICDKVMITIFISYRSTYIFYLCVYVNASSFVCVK